MPINGGYLIANTSYSATQRWCLICIDLRVSWFQIAGLIHGITTSCKTWSFLAFWRSGSHSGTFWHILALWPQPISRAEETVLWWGLIENGLPSNPWLYHTLSLSWFTMFYLYKMAVSCDFIVPCHFGQTHVSYCRSISHHVPTNMKNGPSCCHNISTRLETLFITISWLHSPLLLHSPTLYAHGMANSCELQPPRYHQISVSCLLSHHS